MSIWSDRPAPQKIQFSDTHWSFISFLCHTRLLCISIAVIIINIMILNHNDHDDHHNLISMLSGHLPWHLFFGWVFLTLHCLWSLSSSSFHHPLNPHHNPHNPQKKIPKFPQIQIKINEILIIIFKNPHQNPPPLHFPNVLRKEASAHFSLSNTLSHFPKFSAYTESTRDSSRSSPPLSKSATSSFLL